MIQIHHHCCRLAVMILLFLIHRRIQVNLPSSRQRPRAAAAMHRTIHFQRLEKHKRRPLHHHTKNQQAKLTEIHQLRRGLYRKHALAVAVKLHKMNTVRAAQV